MKTQYSNLVRWGVIVLPVAGILALAGTLLHGPIIDATRDAQSFVQSATTSSFSTGWVLVILSQVAAIFGFIALYGVLSEARGSSTALVGMVLTIIGTALFLSLTGFMAFAAPVAAQLYQQGDTKMLDVIVAGFFGGSVLSVLYPSGLIGTLGSILFGVAIWRSGTLPKWVAVAFALCIPLSAFGPAISEVFDLLGGVCLLVSGVWVAASMWRTVSTVPARA